MGKKFSLFIVFVIGWIFLPAHVAAEGIPYSVKIIKPNNQINSQVSYFDLRMMPKQEQEMNIEVINITDQPIELVVEPHNAATNVNGVITYDRNVKNDESLKYPLTEIISPKQEIQLQPKEQKQLKFQLKMPKEEYAGIILGGLYFYQKDDQGKKEDKQQVQIRNKFAYIVGIQLSENDQVIQPELHLKKVKAGLRNYRTTIYANLQNSEAVIVRDLKIKTEIFSKKDPKKAIYTQEKENMKMAPNSNFDFPVNLQGTPLRPGKYKARIIAATPEKSWRFEKEFEISKKEAKEYNHEAVDLSKNESLSKWLWLAIILLVLVIVLLSVGFIIYHKRQKEFTLSKQKKNKKRKSSRHK